MAEQGLIQEAFGQTLLQELNATLEQRVGERTQTVEKLNVGLESRILQRTHELQESEERFRLLAENAQDVIFRMLFSPHPHVEYISPACNAVFGCSQAEFYADPGLFYGNVHPDDYPLIAPDLEQQPKRAAFRWVRKDGSTIWLEVGASPILGEAGDVVGIDGIARDVTQHQQSQDQLQVRVLQQAAIAELGQVALLSLDLQQLKNETASTIARILDVGYTYVLDLLPAGRGLLLRAGVGWRDGLVGQTTVPLGTRSMAGYTLESAQPVVVRDLTAENRFSPSALLVDHEIVSGVAVAIEGPKRQFGVLGALTGWERAFSADDVNFLLAIASVMGRAIERQESESEIRGLNGSLEQRVLQQAAVAELGQVALTGGDLPELLRDAAVLVGRILDVEFTEVQELLPDESAFLLRAGIGWKAGIVGAATTAADDSSMAGYTLAAGQPVVVGDMRTEQRFHPSPMIGDHNVVSGVAVEIRGVRRTIGVLGALTARERAFSDDDVNFLLAAGNVLGRAIERKQSESELQGLYGSLEQRVLQQAAVAELGQHALTGGDLPELLHDAALLIGRILDVEFTEVLELLPDESAFLLRAGIGWKAGIVGEATAAAGNASLAGYTLDAGRPVIVEDMRSEQRFHPSPVIEDHQVISGAAVEIRGVRRTIGVLGALTAREREFSADDVNFLLAAASVLGRAIERKLSEGEIRGLNESLEQRVLLRTAQLERINQELAESRQALQVAKDEADSANRAKSEFLSRMSHELRTPLNAVLGFSQLLSMDELAADQLENVGYITRAGRHLLGLINEVLDIARIEAGRLSLSLEPVSVSQVTLETLELVRPLTAEHTIRLSLGTHEREDVTVVADLQRLKQVLLNLLANAIKYNREGGTVEVSWEKRPQDRLRIVVRDTGPGIAPQDLSRLFNSFDRLGAEQTGVEGTGLGLALCKRLIQAMNGSIGVESVAGEGSSFWFELPVAAPQETSDDQPDVPGSSMPVGDRPGGYTILYVEDNLSNLKLIERILARRPELKLIPAMQGRMGVELARQHHPDLILLDLQLPDISGEEVLRQLLASDQTSQIPVIVVSADATPTQAERLLAAGARVYLTKPIQIPELLALIDATLRKEDA